MNKIAITLITITLFTALAQNPEPSYGGEITIAIVAEPPGWDPTISTSQEIPRVVYHNVYEGLVRFAEDGSIVPALATSWTVSDDGLIWKFVLRQGIKFHDGTDFTAEHVVAKFERATNPDKVHTHQEYYEAINAVIAEGNTIEFKLKKPNSSLLYNLARPDSIIYPEELQESQAAHPIGTGPFRFVEYLEGNKIRLERNDEYYLEGVPYLEAVTYRIIPDTNVQLLALKKGEIDLIGVALSPENALQIDKDPQLKLIQGTATTEITLAMNNSREPLNDPLVRRAITHAIDKKTLVEGAMFGFGTVIGTHMSPAEPYYVDLDTYPYDPKLAKELLAEAEYPDGFELKLELPEPYNLERRSGLVVAQMLTEVGIKADVSIVDWATWLNRIFLGGDYDMTIIGHSEPRDINIYGNPDYYYQYDSPAVRELLAAVENLSNEQAQVAVYQSIARIIAKDAVNVWLFSPPYLVGARSDIYGYWANQPTPAIDVTGVYRAP